MSFGRIALGVGLGVASLALTAFGVHKRNELLAAECEIENQWIDRAAKAMNSIDRGLAMEHEDVCVTYTSKIARAAALRGDVNICKRDRNYELMEQLEVQIAAFERTGK